MPPKVTGTGILIFATDDNIRHCSQADTYVCDDTFNKCSAIFTQLYSIHAFVEGKMYPLVYGLLLNKESTYRRVFKLVSQRTRAINVHLAPDFAFTDFETAAQNSLRTTFPRCTLHGCFFHYGRTVWKYANKCNQVVRRAIAPPPPPACSGVNQVVPRAIALPLVPVFLVGDVWFHQMSPKTPTFSASDYTTTYWVEGEQGRSTWNHYDTDGPRTTNHVEGWHGKLSQQMSGSHPNIYRLIDIMKTEQSFVEGTILQPAV